MLDADPRGHALELGLGQLRPLEKADPVRCQIVLEQPWLGAIEPVEVQVCDVGRARVAWNRMLLQHGLAPAVASLMADVARKVPASELGPFYAAWPDPNSGVKGLLLDWIGNVRSCG